MLHWWDLTANGGPGFRTTFEAGISFAASREGTAVAQTRRLEDGVSCAGGWVAEADMDESVQRLDEQQVQWRRTGQSKAICGGGPAE